MNNSDATRIYDTAGNTTFAGMGYEYLPMNTNPQELDRIPRSSSDNLNIKEFDQEYNRITLCLENTGTQEEFVEVPLVYYRGYKARDINSGLEFPVEYGTNSRIRIKLPINLMVL